MTIRDIPNREFVLSIRILRLNLGLEALFGAMFGVLRTTDLRRNVNASKKTPKEDSIGVNWSKWRRQYEIGHELTALAENRTEGRFFAP